MCFSVMGPEGERRHSPRRAEDVLFRIIGFIVKIKVKDTLVHFVLLDLVLFVFRHHRLEVIEQTFRQEIMKEVFKNFGL